MTMFSDNYGWAKCADGTWRRPDDYPGQQLPVPALEVQPDREWPDHPTYRGPGPYVEPIPLAELAALNPGLDQRGLARLQALAQLIAEDDQACGYQDPEE